MKRLITLTINNEEHELAVRPNQTLVEVLRYELGLTGTKQGCGVGDCGTCTVIMDGKPVNACLVLAVQANGKSILTIEGLDTNLGLHPIQQAFIEEDGFQCGFCTSGQIMAAKALLESNPTPSPEEIKRGMSGNLCRCGAYLKIFRSVERASELLQKTEA